MIRLEKKGGDSAKDIASRIVYQDGRLWVPEGDTEAMLSLTAGRTGREQLRELRREVMKIYPTDVAWTLDKPLFLLYSAGSRKLQDNRWYWAAPFVDRPGYDREKVEGMTYTDATEYFLPATLQDWADAMEDASIVLSEFTDKPHAYLSKQIDTLVKDGVYLFAAVSDEREAEVLSKTLSILFEQIEKILDTQRKEEISGRLYARLDNLAAGQSALGMPDMGGMDASKWLKGTKIVLESASKYGLLRQRDKCAFEIKVALHSAAAGLETNPSNLAQMLLRNKMGNICSEATPPVLLRDEDGSENQREGTQRLREKEFAHALFDALKEELKQRMTTEGMAEEWTPVAEALDRVVNASDPDAEEEWLLLCDGVLDAAANRYDWDVFAEYHTQLIDTVRNGGEGAYETLYAQTPYFDSAQRREGSSKVPEFQEEPPAV